MCYYRTEPIACAAEKTLRQKAFLRKPTSRPTMRISGQRYKIFGTVTNIDYQSMSGDEILHWLHERCGKNEEEHSVMKDDLADCKFPSKICFLPVIRPGKNGNDVQNSSRITCHKNEVEDLGNSQDLTLCLFGR